MKITYNDIPKYPYLTQTSLKNLLLTIDDSKNRKDAQVDNVQIVRDLGILSLRRMSLSNPLFKALRTIWKKR